MAKTPAPKPAALDINALKQELLNAGTAGTQQFIGLPSTLGPQVANVPAGTQAPRYYEGAQWLPQAQNFTPQQVADLQTKMINAGLLDKDFRLGVWDAPSQQAFTQVLGLANASGTEWQQALSQYENSQPMNWDPTTGTFTRGAGVTARQRTPLVTRLTSPDDLATTAQEVAVSRLGRNLTGEEMQKFVSSFHGTEQAAQQAAYAASGSGLPGGPGGQVTQPAGADVAAKQFAERADPTAYQANAFLPLVDRVNKLLGGQGFQVGNPLKA